MINVRVTQNHGVKLVRVEGELFIAISHFLAVTLVKPTFEEKIFAVDLDEIHRTRGRACGAKDVEFHDATLLALGWRGNSEVLAQNEMDFYARLASVGHRMKNDTTTTVLNFALAALVILGVVFALMSIMRQHELRGAQVTLQGKMQMIQIVNNKAQMLANDALAYNEKAKNPELAHILQAAQAPQQPAAK